MVKPPSGGEPIARIRRLGATHEEWADPVQRGPNATKDTVERGGMGCHYGDTEKAAGGQKAIRLADHRLCVGRSEQVKDVGSEEAVATAVSEREQGRARGGEDVCASSEPGQA